MNKVIRWLTTFEHSSTQVANNSLTSMQTTEYKLVYFVCVCACLLLRPHVRGHREQEQWSTAVCRVDTKQPVCAKDRDMQGGEMWQKCAHTGWYSYCDLFLACSKASTLWILTGHTWYKTVPAVQHLHQTGYQLQSTQWHSLSRAHTHIHTHIYPEHTHDKNKRL